MQENPIANVVIVGGGTAGWMTAAALSKFLNMDQCNVTLIESDQISTIGVGEATLPHLRFFNQTLGIDEGEFMRETNATYKIGIEFSGWGNKDSAYIHPFGDYGFPINDLPFHQFWNALRLNGYRYPIDDFSLPVLAAYDGKFDYPSQNQRSMLSTFSYAFHLDASLYAQYLRKFSEKNGVQRTEGKITQVIKADNGDIQSVALESGVTVHGDLFIDCSGARALLLGQALNVEYKSWDHWLPCDRAIAIPTENATAPLPYTKAMATEAGWQWRIPLQHRTGNGHVYSSAFISDDAACDSLINNIVGKAKADPFFIKFNVGHREKTWSHNCIAIGLSAGFLEPLESTGIHLIQTAITKLLELFPTKNIKPSTRDEFNRVMTMKYNSVRDFLILHYHATNRTDTEFWNHCRTMAIPDELQHSMDLFKSRGHISYQEGNLFLEPSWVAVYLGQGIQPHSIDPRIKGYPLADVEQHFEGLRKMTREAADIMPMHADAIAKNCQSDAKKLWPEASMSLYGRKP